MRLVLAATLVLATYAACVVLVRAVRRHPAGIAAALGAALMVCYEAALLQVLSLFHAVVWPALAIGQLALVGIVALRMRPLPRLGFPSLSGPRLWIAALGMLALGSGLAYLPNNGDSMTYHLARVVYWLENRSVQPYPTNIVRQVAFPPGAEYLLLILQSLSNSDRLANLVQLGAWVVVAFALPPLARAFGAGRTLSLWAGFLFATAPMALVQASSTQNDLIASVMAVAIVAACRPFLHTRPHWRAADLGLLGATISAGLLVKPTSLLAAAPFLLWAVVRSRTQLFPAAVWRRARQSFPVLAVIALVTAGSLWPALQSGALAADESGVVKPFVYSGIADLMDRLVNPVRGLVRNLPLPWEALDRLAPVTTFGCEEEHKLCLEKNRLLVNDDTAANPAQVVFLLVATLTGLLRWRRLPPRGRIASLCAPAAWLLMHLFVRDNVFVARLQLPVLALVPLGLAAFDRVRKPTLVSLGRLAIAGTAAFGALAVTVNGRRPLTPLLVRLSSEGGYYSLVPPGLKRGQDEALHTIEESGCRRLGMYVGENTYDYPIGWAAFQHGIEVRHILAAEEWPCAVYSDRGPPPAGATGWVQGKAPLVYLRPPAGR